MDAPALEKPSRGRITGTKRTHGAENRMKNEASKKTILFVLGFFFLLVGVALILRWWPYLEIVFKGILGVVLALAGLVMLFLAK